MEREALLGRDAETPPSHLMAERKPHFLPSLRNEGDLSSPPIPPRVNQRSGRAELHPHSLLGSPSCLLSLLRTVIGTGASQERGPGSLFGHGFQDCKTRSTLPPCTPIFLSVPNYKTPPRDLRCSHETPPQGRCALPQEGVPPPRGRTPGGRGQRTWSALPPASHQGCVHEDWPCPCGLIITTTIIGAAGVEGTKATPP